MAFIDTLHYRQLLEEEIKFHREAGNDNIVMGLEIAVAVLADEPAAPSTDYWINCNECIFYEDCEAKEDRDGCILGEKE